MNRKKTLLILGFLLASFIRILSQVSFSGDDMNSEFKRAMDLFSKEKYSAAIIMFDDFVRRSGSDDVERSEAEYYAALSALKLFNPDAEYRMLMYIASHPESP